MTKAELEALDQEILDALWLKVVFLCFVCVTAIVGLGYVLLTTPTETYYHTPLTESVTREV